MVFDGFARSASVNCDTLTQVRAVLSRFLSCRTDCQSVLPFSATGGLASFWKEGAPYEPIRPRRTSRGFLTWTRFASIPDASAFGSAKKRDSYFRNDAFAAHSAAQGAWRRICRGWRANGERRNRDGE